jgi:hypothetical protein
MAKKKQPVQEQDKIFEVISAVYEQFNWPIGWTNYEKDDLEEMLANAVSDLGYWPNSPEDFILHETLNSFKGNSDNLKAFLFLDTADAGGLFILNTEALEKSIPAVKGTLIILRGWEYVFVKSASAKRRVLELIF